MRHLIITDSDIIEAVGYDEKNERIEVVFKATPDQVYQYVGTEHEFVLLVTADSVGSHFHKTLKKRQFTKSMRSTPIQKK